MAEPNVKKTSFFRALAEIWHETSATFSDTLQLSLLEMRLAGVSLFYIIALVVLILFFFTSAWLCFLGLIIAILVYLHLTWILSFLIVMGVNLLVAVIALCVVLHLRKNLNLKSTLRQFTSKRTHP